YIANDLLVQMIPSDKVSNGFVFPAGFV
ncbi:MAG: hypothetical protein ACJARG_001563, partial [Arcticibacterium sp.]